MANIYETSPLGKEGHEQRQIQHSFPLPERDKSTQEKRRAKDERSNPLTGDSQAQVSETAGNEKTIPR